MPGLGVVCFIGKGRSRAKGEAGDEGFAVGDQLVVIVRGQGLSQQLEGALLEEIQGEGRALLLPGFQSPAGEDAAAVVSLPRIACLRRFTFAAAPEILQRFRLREKVPFGDTGDDLVQSDGGWHPGEKPAAKSRAMAMSSSA